jgi:hypothetical protein
MIRVITRRLIASNNLKRSIIIKQQRFSYATSTTGPNMNDANVIRTYAQSYLKKGQIDKCLHMLSVLNTKFYSNETAKHTKQLLLALSKYSNVTIADVKSITEFANRRNIVSEDFAKSILFMIINLQQGRIEIDTTVDEVWKMIAPALVNNWQHLKSDEVVSILQQKYQIEPNNVIVNLLLNQFKPVQFNRAHEFLFDMEQKHDVKPDVTSFKILEQLCTDQSQSDTVKKDAQNRGITL